MRILVTGGDGFIGRNLRLHLGERGYADVVSLEQGAPEAALLDAVAHADFVFHLAGVNRPTSVADFDVVNRGFTATLCEALVANGRRIPLAFTSSTQALVDNPYGASKRAAEQEIARYAETSGARVHLLRLTNVFGKWCRPNYNSVVATFCHNIAHGLPITINDPAARLELVYIDDVVRAMTDLLKTTDGAPTTVDVRPVYDTTVGELASMLREFAASRDTRLIPRVGSGFTRALYATYVSYLSPEAFAYSVPRHPDARGVFAEMLRTPDCGQFSFFTARPGVTRGGHYHHTKNEKFLVLSGRAKFRFRHLVTAETHEILVAADESRVVDTVPGWAHDVTNVGDEELIIMLWANEIFDPERPDTIPAPLDGSVRRGDALA